MDKAGKSALKDALSEKFTKAQSIMLAEYRGMTVQQLTTLRCELRNLNAEIKISKNRVTRLAVEEAEGGEFAQVKELLKGPAAVVFVYGDPAPVAKTLVATQKEVEKFKVKSGMLDGQLLTPANISEIATLPSKEVLLGQICGVLESPAKGVAVVVSTVVRNLAMIAGAIRDTKK